MSHITQILIDILATALSAALIALIRAGIVWVGTKVKSEKVCLALQELSYVLEDGVNYIEQTFVKNAKQYGNWDKNTQKQALESCLAYVTNNLTQSTLDILTEDKDEIEDWLTAKIEAFIYQNK